MKRRRVRAAAGLVLLIAIGSIGIGQERRLANPGPGEASSAPGDATRCDISLPLKIDLVPLNQAVVGNRVRFQVDLESSLDPDEVRDIRVEYELPERLRFAAEIPDAGRSIRKSGRTRMEMGFVVPDETRYAVRARVVVELAGGRTISQTATRWIDLGDEDPPEGMIGRIVDPDGTGIRVYQGVTVRN